jgi:acetyl-CoA C-acetyltransferase
MHHTKPIHIIQARRSPIGRFGGGLKSLTPAELGALVAGAVVPESQRAQIDQVIVGQVLQAASGMNVARQIALGIGIPHSAPAFVANMVCGSGMKAVALAADAIASGESGLVLAGGVEVMSRAPHYMTELRWGRKMGDGALQDAIFVDGLTDPTLRISMGETAEQIASSFNISRESQDAFALRSQRLAIENRDGFRRELICIITKDGTVTDDEHPRADTTAEKLAQLKPAFRKDGSVTAGNSSGVNDGAAMLLLASDKAVRQSSLHSRARIVGSTTVGCDPAMMGLGPVHAIRKLVAEIGWPLAEVEAVEINEAFAVQSLACISELNLRPDQVNQRGGAIALGHPIGASGARVVVTLLHILEDKNLKRGIASLCIGGGMGIAMALER